MKTALALLFLAATMSAQLKLKVGPKQGPPPPQQQPGDSVEIDPVTQDIVATSNGMTFRFPLENRIEPKLAFELSRIGPEYTYTYSLANGAGARQWIPGFAFQCRFHEQVRLFAPQGWRVLPGGPAVDFQSLIFLHHVRDDETESHLSAGRTAGPFRMVSPLSPGLVRVTVHAAPPTRLATELAVGEKMGFLSPWANERMDVFYTADRQLKYVLTVGPKVPPEDDSVSQIRMELAFASGQPEFQGIHMELAALVKNPAKEAIQQRLGALKGTEFQSKFFQALLWRLESLK